MNTHQRIKEATTDIQKVNEIDSTLLCLTLRRKQQDNLAEFRSWLNRRAVMRRRAR